MTISSAEPIFQLWQTPNTIKSSKNLPPLKTIKVLGICIFITFIKWIYMETQGENLITKSKTMTAFRFHSMARANLNKVENFIPQYQITMYKSTYIIYTLPFKTPFWLLNAHVNITLIINHILTSLCLGVWMGGFQLSQIMGLLDLYFDVAVVLKFLTLFRLALAILGSWLELKLSSAW